MKALVLKLFLLVRTPFAYISIDKEGVPLGPPVPGRRLRVADLRARTREERLIPVKRRLAAISAGFRPAHETIVWNEPPPTEQPALWKTEEETWETHCRELFRERDAIIEHQGRDAWVRWQTWKRQVRTERIRRRRLAGWPPA